MNTKTPKGAIFADIARTNLDEAEYLTHIFGRLACDIPVVAMTPAEKREAMHGLFSKIGKSADDLHLCGRHAEAQNILEICKRDAKGDETLVQAIETTAVRLQELYRRDY